MKDKRISQTVEDLLNKQVGYEMGSFYTYHHISNWCGANGYLVAERFFREYAHEEGMHVENMMKYLLDRNCMPITPAMPKMENEYNSLLDVFNKIYEFMKDVTANLRDIYSSAVSDNDYNTSSFVQKYIIDQTEVEATYSNIIARLELLDGNMVGILDLEEDLEDILGIDK